MSNTVTFNKHDYVVSLRKRLNKMTTWMDVMNVKYTDVRTIVNSALSTEPSVVAGTRGTAYAYDSFALTADTLTIDQYKNIPIFIDEADRHQQSYMNQQSIADFQGKKINEFLETTMLGSHASWVNFGATDLTNTGDDDTTAITVSASNIDDIIRAIKRKINAHSGTDLAVENGIFVIWRPGDMEFLEAFAQANGFTEADMALKNGIPVQRGFYYGGITNYMSTSHAAGHLFAGVKRVGKDLGILRSTYGKAKFIEDPGLKSGLGIVSRVDYGFNFPTGGPSGRSQSELSMDINVA